MKKLIKEICVRENLKKETHIAQVREVMKTVCAIIIAGTRTDRGFYDSEFMAYLDKMITKSERIVKKNPSITYDELVVKLLGRNK